MSASASSSSSADVSTPGPSEAGAVVGRRVQPRHFHYGPNPAAATSAHAAAGPPPVARLYRHALESVFAFLGQRELAFSLRVSRDWLTAAQSMASLQLHIQRAAAPLRAVAASAMGRHVSVIRGAETPLFLNIDALFIVARFMPHLRGLYCELDLPPAGEPLSFPAALRKREIDQHGPVSAAQLTVTLTAVGRLSQLESFTIMLPARPDPRLSFAPLAALPQLRGLDVSWPEGGSLSDTQLDELRTMPWLQQLSLPVMKTETLRRLLRQPHDLQWLSIWLPDELDDETAALLPQLPSLTRINAMVGCERFDWLRGLPNLTEVDLAFSEAAGAGGRAESLTAGLQSCKQIEILRLRYCADLTAAHLAELLPRLPRLRELVLIDVPIESLSFLAQPPMTDQLVSLCLDHCQQLPLPELRHVHALRALQKLQLFVSFTAPLDEYCQSLYEPPSILMPQLDEFHCSELEEQDVEPDDDE